jgi:hypothetical protein
MNLFHLAILEAKKILKVDTVFSQGNNYAFFDTPNGIFELCQMYPINGNPDAWVIINETGSYNRGYKLEILHILKTPTK